MNKLKTYLWAGIIAGSTLLSSCGSDIDETKFSIKILNPTQEWIKNILSIDYDFSECFEKWDTVFVKKPYVWNEYWPRHLSKWPKDYGKGLKKIHVEKAIIEFELPEIKPQAKIKDNQMDFNRIESEEFQAESEAISSFFMWDEDR